MLKAAAVLRGLALLAILPAILLASFPIEGGALAAPARRVIVLEGMDAEVVRTHTRMFRAELIKLARAKGYTVKIEMIRAEGDFEKARSRLIKALAKGEPDLVATNATLASTVALEVLGGEVPILFMTVSDPGATARKAAGIADAVLRGKPPGSIAAEPPDAFNLGVNITTARRMGVVIPVELMELAGRNIYR